MSERREYIVEYELDDEDGTSMFEMRMNERIVRCRDCIHYARSEAWPDCWDCKRTGLPADDDMFCAWGVREDETNTE